MRVPVSAQSGRVPFAFSPPGDPMTSPSPVKTLRIAMNGVTGRMGYRQHLVRSILPIRDQGGVVLEDGSRVQVEPILVGRNAEKVRELADLHGVESWSTDADSLIADDSVDIYFDAQVTSRRASALKSAFAIGKHTSTEK